MLRRRIYDSLYTFHPNTKSTKSGCRHHQIDDFQCLYLHSCPPAIRPDIYMCSPVHCSHIGLHSDKAQTHMGQFLVVYVDVYRNIIYDKSVSNTLKKISPRIFTSFTVIPLPSVLTSTCVVLSSVVLTLASIQTRCRLTWVNFWWYTQI